MSKPQHDDPPAYSAPAQPPAAYQGAVAYPEGHQQLQQQGPPGAPGPEQGGYYQPNPNMGYYQPQPGGYPPPQGGYYQQGPYGQPQGGCYGPPQGGYYGQPGGYYGQPGGYYGQPQGRYQNQSSSPGCLEGILAGLACCCCLDLLF